MGTVYFTRHGQTVWNVENKIVDKLHPVWVFTGPVEKGWIIHIGLWIKRTCGTK